MACIRFLIATIWFIRLGPPGSQWLMIANMSFDPAIIKTIDDWRALMAVFAEYELLARAWVIALTAQFGGVEKRQEWNTPPREITAELQPNKP